MLVKVTEPKSSSGDTEQLVVQIDVASSIHWLSAQANYMTAPMLPKRRSH